MRIIRAKHVPPEIEDILGPGEYAGIDPETGRWHVTDDEWSQALDLFVGVDGDWSKDPQAELSLGDSVRRLHQSVHRALEADAPWKAKYEFIFELYRESRVTVDWLDLDTSYEEDVLSFVRGLDAMAAEHGVGETDDWSME